MTDAEIRQELLNAGWSHSDIPILETHAPIPANDSVQTPMSTHSRLLRAKRLSTIIAIGFFLTAGVLAARHYFNTHTNENTATAALHPSLTPIAQAPSSLSQTLKTYENQFLRFSYRHDYNLTNNVVVLERGNPRYSYHAISLKNNCCLVSVVFFPYQDRVITQEEELQRVRNRFAELRDDIELQGLQQYAQERLEEIVVDGKQGLRVFQSAIDQGENFRMGLTEVTLPLITGIYKITMNWRTEELNDPRNAEHEGLQVIMDSFDILGVQ